MDNILQPLVRITLNIDGAPITSLLSSFFILVNKPTWSDCVHTFFPEQDVLRPVSSIFLSLVQEIRSNLGLCFSFLVLMSFGSNLDYILVRTWTTLTLFLLTGTTRLITTAGKKLWTIPVSIPVSLFPAKFHQWLILSLNFQRTTFSTMGTGMTPFPQKGKKEFNDTKNYQKGSVALNSNVRKRLGFLKK